MSEQQDKALIQNLNNLKTIRLQAHKLLKLAQENRSNYFSINPQQRDPTADFVIEVMKENYPDLNIPYHSRWRHFEACGPQYMEQIEQWALLYSPNEFIKILCELVIISVFLDAGAGALWHYKDTQTEQQFTRSEGLALASLIMYQQGFFSKDPENPLRVDAHKLISLTQADLIKGFQITPDNPLEGLAGRLALINRLGRLMLENNHYFGSSARLGNFYSFLHSLAQDQKLSAIQIFEAVLAAFKDMWPPRLQLNGFSLGDVGIHSALKSAVPGSEYQPFHKLSQWLSYSLLEPLQKANLEIIEIEELTGLPEYRNGGLLIDSGWLVVKNQQLLEHAQDPNSEAIVEWRGLTLALLDELALTIRDKLHMPELSLAKILQGGTWEAGRRFAKIKRPQGTPPIQIISDGTLF